MTELTILAFLAAGLSALGSHGVRLSYEYRDEDPIWHGLRGQKAMRAKYGNEGARQRVRRSTTMLRDVAGRASIVLALMAAYNFLS